MSGPLRFQVHAASDTGRCRPLNEDSIGHYQTPDGRLVAALADGVGGRPGGALASRLAVTRVLEALAEAGQDAEALRAAALAANATVNSARAAHAGYEEMATTLIALLARGREAFLLHAGDSRGYRWRDGKLEPLTRDDTVAEQMVADGTLAPEDVGRTPYQHMLTRALGGRELPHSLSALTLRPGDRLLLCSDGLTKPLDDAAIAALLASAADGAAAVAALIDAANAAGGPDNVSVILISCEEEVR
jgi:serine/threonine protein phosphatase PrpC